MTEAEEKLNISLANLRKANERLKEALVITPDDLIRDGTIKRFEFTFELAWKTIKLALKFNKKIETNNPRDALREAFRAKWIEDWNVWEALLDARNEIVHLYDEGEAKKTYFLIKEKQNLIDALIKKLTLLK